MYMWMKNKNVWFKGREIAQVLGYINTKKAVMMHVDEDDKQKWEQFKGEPK